MKLLKSQLFQDIVLLFAVHIACVFSFKITYIISERLHQYLPIILVAATIASLILHLKYKNRVGLYHRELPVKMMLVCALTLNLMDTLTGVHFWQESRSIFLAMFCLGLSVLSFKYPAFILSNLVGTLTLLISERSIINSSSMADRSLMIEIAGVISFVYIALVALRFLGVKSSKLKGIPYYIYLSLVVAYLYGPGISKILFDSWLWNNNTYQLVLNSIASPWPIIPYEYLAHLKTFFEQNRVILNTLVVANETLPFIGVIIPQLLIPGIIGFILLHVVIFLGSGIFFWKWIIVEIGAILAILHLRRKNSLGIHYRAYLIVVAVCFRFFTWNGADMHWYDGKILSDYIFSIGKNFEDREVIPYYLFKPLEIHFAQKEFRFLDPDKTLITTYGTLRNYPAYMDQFKIKNLEDYQLWLSKYGIFTYNEAKSAWFLKTLKQHICNVSKSNFLERANLRIPHAWHIEYLASNKLIFMSDLCSPTSDYKIFITRKVYLVDDTVSLLEAKLIRTVPLHD